MRMRNLIHVLQIQKDLQISESRDLCLRNLKSIQVADIVGLLT